MPAWIFFLAFSHAQAPAGGMQVQIGEMEVNGLTVSSASCTLAPGQLPFGLWVGLSTQAAALDACDPAGGAWAVKWSMADGKVAAVTVTPQAGGPKAAPACLQAALAKAPAPVAGQCEATLLVGDRAAAKRELGK